MGNRSQEKHVFSLQKSEMDIKPEIVTPMKKETPSPKKRTRGAGQSAGKPKRRRIIEPDSAEEDSGISLFHIQVIYCQTQRGFVRNVLVFLNSPLPIFALQFLFLVLVTFYLLKIVIIVFIIIMLLTYF